VVEGLDVARRIQMSPADAEEQLTPPVMIRSASLIGEVPPGCRP
jgi:peptidyl-prolyl cis-trans isomerase A (cyclophilin A)